jgi:hypothetical protein
MSANKIIEQRACVSCAAPWDLLSPKGSSGSEVHHCECMDCGHRNTYILPKTCLNCGTVDWADYESGNYPEDCPFCGAIEWVEPT